MRSFSVCVVLAVAVSGVYAVPASSGHVLHEKRDYVPAAWQHKYKAKADAQVPVRIGLTQGNLHKGEELLMRVSDHASPEYGQWYTAEQINDLFAPAEETVSTVRAWLEEAGFASERLSHSVNKQWMQFDASIEELENLVKAKYHVYEHETGKLHTACDEYHVPEHVTPHVDYITPGIKLYYPSIAKRSTGLDKRGYKNPPLLKDYPVTAQGNGNLAICDSVISPPCIRAMYNITLGTLDAPGNKLGIFEALNDHYTQEDLNDFFSSAFPKIPQGTHPELRGIDGAIGPLPVQDAGPESDLDFQISYPIIYPQGSVLFQTDDQVYESNYTFNGFLNNFLDAIDGSYCTYSAFGETGNAKIDPPYPDPAKGGYKGKLQCGVYKPTNVISISYGGAEAGLSVNYQKRQCNEFMKLGMQGVTVVSASGDYGVADPPGSGPTGNGCMGQKGRIFTPQFPVNCPYVVSLGATFLPSGADVKKDEEVAVTRFGSGGGFSNIYEAPSWQQSAVNGFLTKYPPPYVSYQTTDAKKIGPGRFNSIGRGSPDFAAVGDNVLIYYGGNPHLIGGTSASAPTFAAIINRINEERIAAGKGTVGFVSPTLYAHPKVFNDITVGNNPGCGTNGFEAQPGWDPVTGLGTPDYPKMLKLFMSLP